MRCRNGNRESTYGPQENRICLLPECPEPRSPVKGFRIAFAGSTNSPTIAFPPSLNNSLSPLNAYSLSPLSDNSLSPFERPL